MTVERSPAWVSRRHWYSALLITLLIANAGCGTTTQTVGAYRAFAYEEPSLLVSIDRADDVIETLELVERMAASRQDSRFHPSSLLRISAHVGREMPRRPQDARSSPRSSPFRLRQPPTKSACSATPASWLRSPIAWSSRRSR